MLQVYKLGLIEYDAAFSLQDKLQAMRIAGEIPDTLLLLEHPPTLTLAKGDDHQYILVSEETLNERGIAVHRTDRGGKITLHGRARLWDIPF